MTARYSAPSVEAIIEDSEDESRQELRDNHEEYTSDPFRRQHRPSHYSAMSPTKESAGKERERSRRTHKSAANGSKHAPKNKSKTTSGRRSNVMARDSDSEGSRPRHRRRLSNRSTSSSSSEDDEPVQDHRAVLAAARARLTSPSMISTYTSLTTSTNKSSGSSGSNSTVTQASITKRSNLEKRPEIEEAPEASEALMSPAVPDPPNVFAFLENDGSPDSGSDKDEEQEEEEENEEEEAQATSEWPSNQHESSYVQPSLPQHIAVEQSSSSSSSTSSSFHGDDDSSSPAVDNDTDRSTSPERSVKDHESDHETSSHTDQASAKIALQMAAAQQRQNLHGSMQSYGTPNMQRGNANLPHIPQTALSARYQQPLHQHPLPRAEKLPVTGYELLASRLASHGRDSDDGATIRPMYRKFEALNHRILLHLQDEISELEEQLHRLDHADTQSRRTDRQIIPASRRAAAQAGGELQWHKTDILGRIGYKLAQYNQALSSFNTTNSLHSPDPDDITQYREYLHTEHPIAEPETHFLDPDNAEDLVSVCSSIPPSTSFSSYPSQSSLSSSSAPSQYQPSSPPTPMQVELNVQPGSLPGLATAVAVAVLVPILTFNVIPQFIGRLTVTALVAVGVIFALMQSGVLGKGMLFGREAMSCAGIYGGVMIVFAGIMA